MKRAVRKMITAAMSGLLVLVFSQSFGTHAAADVQNPVIVDIRIGGSHVLALDSDGGVWSWGIDLYGSLGHGDRNNIPAPAKIATLPAVKSIAAGKSHSLAVDKDGNVWVWGLNTEGQFGNGKKGTVFLGWVDEDGFSNVPVRNGLTGIASVAADLTKSFAIDHEGRLYEWGEPLYYHNMAGDDPKEQQAKLVPRMVQGPKNIVYVTYTEDTDSKETYALDRDGNVWFWDGTEIDSSGRLIAKQMPELGKLRQFRVWREYRWAQKIDGTWTQWGAELFDTSLIFSPYKLFTQLGYTVVGDFETPRMDGFAQIEISNSRGIQSLVGLKPDGTVWTWGDNGDGQLGVEGVHQTEQWTQVNLPGKVTKVAAHDGTVFAITEDGEVYSWGSNEYNRLGDGSTAAKRNLPKLLKFEAAAASAEPQPATGLPTAEKPAAAQTSTRIYLNGNLLDFEALFIEGNTMVPFRSLFGAFGMGVDWDPQSGTITAKKDGLTIRLTVGSTTAYVNNEKKPLSVAPVAVNGKTFVNLRFISETIGAQVQYNKLASGAEIRITYES